MKSEVNISLKAGEVTPQKAFDWFQKKDFISVPPYFLTHWKTKKCFFFFEGSLIAFEKTKSQLIITGEPALTTDVNKEHLYKAFLDFARLNKKKVCGYYVGQSWSSDRFLKRPLGSSFKVQLGSYDFASSKAKEVRRSLRQGESNDYRILKAEEIEMSKLKILLKKWKVKKLPIKLNFFLSQPNKKSLIASHEKWYVIAKGNQYFAFCSTLPYKNKDANGIYIDHLAHNPSKEKAALSFLISFLIKDLKNKGVDELNLGLNPFANISPNGSVERLFTCLYHMPILYRPKGLHYFKRKFAGEEEPEFFFYEKAAGPWLSLLNIVKTSLNF